MATPKNGLPITGDALWQIVVTVIIFLLGIPVAYWIAIRAARRQAELEAKLEEPSDKQAQRTWDETLRVLEEIRDIQIQNLTHQDFEPEVDETEGDVHAEGRENEGDVDTEGVDVKDDTDPGRHEIERDADSEEHEPDDDIDPENHEPNTNNDQIRPSNG